MSVSDGADLWSGQMWRGAGTTLPELVGKGLTVARGLHHHLQVDVGGKTQPVIGASDAVSNSGRVPSGRHGHRRAKTARIIWAG